MKWYQKWFHADVVFSSIFVFTLLFFVNKIEINADIVDPIGAALEDFQLSDLVYTSLRDDPEKDSTITMVNIGNLNRAELSVLMDNLNQHQPAVIGIDARFFKDKSQFYKDNGLINGDSLLEIAFSKTKNLVLATKLADLNENTSQWDTVHQSLPRFMKSAYEGTVNMITTENDFRVARKIAALDFVKDSIKMFFPVQIASLYNKSKVDKFLQRKKVRELIIDKQKKHPLDTTGETQKFLEIIYFRGNINNFEGPTDVFGKKDAFNKIDVQEGMENSFDPKLVKGKILLLGYMGASIQNNKYWDEDKFYTPLNKKFAGKSFPDMYGVTVHANIVSMILNEKYITELNQTWNTVIVLVLCLIGVIIFSYIHHHNHVWWDGLSVIVMILMILIIVGTQLYVFEYYRIEIDISAVMVFLFVLGNFLELYYEYAKPGALWLIRKTASLFSKK